MLKFADVPELPWESFINRAPIVLEELQEVKSLASMKADDMKLLVETTEE
jgi:hypothetical protein